MEHVPLCDDRTVAHLSRILGKVAIGHAVSFVVDAGMTTRTQEGKTVQIPNGTASIHIYVDGGASDWTEPERPAEMKP